MCETTFKNTIHSMYLLNVIICIYFMLNIFVCVEYGGMKSIILILYSHILHKLDTFSLLEWKLLQHAGSYQGS